MSASRAKKLLSDWNTVRYELLNTRICDLPVQIKGSRLDPMVKRVVGELEAKGLRYRPLFYLTDSWGCPNEVPAVGVPFYLADPLLSRVEEEQTGEIEDTATVMMFLRHETGHAVNYAFRLWERPGWVETFGRFSAPYRDTFQPVRGSRDFVRHLNHSLYGRNYAQKHPDEDFAETFAVWLSPRSGWRRRYRYWPALRKLKYVAGLMRAIRNETPVSTPDRLFRPLSEMTMLLAEHYGERAERFRAAAQGYVDDKLREAFPPYRGRDRARAHELARSHRADLTAAVAKWSGLEVAEVETILDKLEDRAESLRLCYPRGQAENKLVELAALASALAMDFAYTGRFTR